MQAQIVPPKISEADQQSSHLPAGGEGEGDNLAAILADIGDEVGRKLASIEAGITADYALRIIGARQSSPRAELAAMLAALTLAKRAALDAARQQAKAEIQGRRVAAMRDRTRPNRAACSRGLGRGPR